METKKKRTRKKYTEEFKKEAVKLLETRGERTVEDVATGIGVSPNLLHSWRQRYVDIAAQVRKAGNSAGAPIAHEWLSTAQSHLGLDDAPTRKLPLAL